MKVYEMGHSFSYKIGCAASEDSDQPTHPRNLIRILAMHSVGSQGSNTYSDGQRRL